MNKNLDQVLGSFMGILIFLLFGIFIFSFANVLGDVVPDGDVELIESTHEIDMNLTEEWEIYGETVDNTNIYDNKVMLSDPTKEGQFDVVIDMEDFEEFYFLEKHDAINLYNDSEIHLDIFVDGDNWFTIGKLDDGTNSFDEDNLRNYGMDDEDGDELRFEYYLHQSSEDDSPELDWQFNEFHVSSYDQDEFDYPILESLGFLILAFGMIIVLITMFYIVVSE